MTQQLEDLELNVRYVPDFYSKSEADAFFDELLCCPFAPITFNIRGRSFTPSRQVCAYGDPGVIYSFTGTSVPTKPWTPTLLKLKTDVENFTGDCFNYALLNLYPDGNAKISPHKDNEAVLYQHVSIPCLSFGATREMQFTIPDGTRHILDLDHGSLMVMYPPTNRKWKHGIAPQPHVKGPRISITFRRLSSEVVNEERLSSNIEPPSKKVKAEENSWLHEYITSLPETCRQQHKVVETLFKKDVGWGLQVAVVHTSSGLQVQMCPLNTGTSHDFQTAVSICPSIWYEFIVKFQGFNLLRSDSGFLCGNQLLVAVKGTNTCVFQQLYHSVPGFRFKKFSIELDSDEVNLLRECMLEVSEILLEKSFSIFLPFVMLKHKKVFQPDTIPTLYEEMGEEKFWKCVYDYLSYCVNQKYACKMCEVPGSCMCLSVNGKFNILGKYSLLCVNISELSKRICKTVHMEKLTPELINSVTVEKCIEILDSTE